MDLWTYGLMDWMSHYGHLSSAPVQRHMDIRMPLIDLKRHHMDPMRYQMHL